MKLSRILLYGALCVTSLLFLFPVYVLLTTSFKTPAEFATGLWALPSSFNLDGYKQALQSGMGQGILNSLKMTVPAALISSVLSSLTGYVLSKYKKAWTSAVLGFIVLGMFIPYQVVLIPLVQFMSRVRLYNTHAGLILTHVAYGLPICTLIFTNHYATIPEDLLEVARIDGCGVWKIYTRIMLPLSISAFVVTLIWQFTSVWNDFLFGLTLSQGPAVRPATVTLAGLKGTFTANWNVQMAGAILTALPTLIIYLFLGKYFVRGILSGSIKG
ncbi:MAG TPA: carbohydrate ABC transporter permease [Bacillota bacterium]|jgi:glucose/mannose transport system permease protein|nr:carbohydrate ABC transporter permease [Bacillota bacterium]